jgi:undecaprenyl-diphosphatase
MFLIINGIILFLAEKLRKSANQKYLSSSKTDTEISKLSFLKSIFIGIGQAFALFPGISRSGTSMAGSLFFGLDNSAAARFSFLLATPVIGAAAILQLPSIFSASDKPIRTAVLAGFISAGIAAYISVKYLVRYFQTRTLTPFAIYCVLAGIVYSMLLIF